MMANIHQGHFPMTDSGEDESPASRP
jgi:hypothetical protein